jgi:AbrB family looped-hinge helix DNA binding protein
MRTRVSTKGQIVIPSELRFEDSIRPGDNFEIEKIRSGEYLIRKIEEAANRGLRRSPFVGPKMAVFN